MTRDELDAAITPRVVAIPNADAGLGGFFTRVLTPNAVTTYRIVHKTAEEAVAYGKAQA